MVNTGSTTPHYRANLGASPREVFLHPDDAMRLVWAWEDEQRAAPDPLGYRVTDALLLDERGCEVGGPVSAAVYPTYAAAEVALLALDPTRERGLAISVNHW